MCPPLPTDWVMVKPQTQHWVSALIFLVFGDLVAPVLLMCPTLAYMFRTMDQLVELPHPEGSGQVEAAKSRVSRAYHVSTCVLAAVSRQTSVTNCATSEVGLSIVQHWTTTASTAMVSSLVDQSPGTLDCTLNDTQIRSRAHSSTLAHLSYVRQAPPRKSLCLPS